MNVIKTVIAATALAFALSTGAAAQTPPAAAPAKVEATKPAKAAKVAKVKKPAAPRTEVSKQCSIELDAKNVHGKDRTRQMKTCKAAGAKSPAPATAAVKAPDTTKKN